MTQGVQYAGEFIIEEAVLTSPNGLKTDILNDLALIEINIFEDIFRSSITGSILVGDTRNIISKLPIMGQEKLSLKISTPSLTSKKDILDFTESHFSVHKVSARTELSHSSQLYDLQFISTEAIKNNHSRISKSYVQNKSNVGEIVFDLLVQDSNGIRSNKDIFIEETTGNRGLLNPNSNPFTFITRLTKDAISKNNGSSHYLFFENKHGIHFRTLQNLYEQNVVDEFHIGDKGIEGEYGESVQRESKKSGKLLQSYRRINRYTLNTKNDLLLNTISGMFGGRIIEHNIFNKSFNVRTFNYFDKEQFNSNDRVDDNRIYSQNALGKMDIVLNDKITNSKIFVVPITKNSDGYDSSYGLNGTPDRKYDTLLDRQSRMSEIIEGISINMEIHGRTTLAVGDMINVSLPTFGDDDDGKENKFYSGKYMIKRLRHIFKNTSKMHTINLEAVKDGLPEVLKSMEDEISKKSPTPKPIFV